MADSFRFYILGRLPFRQMVNIAETMSLGILLVDEGLVPPVILFWQKNLERPKGVERPCLLTNLFCITVCSVKMNKTSPKV